MRVKFPYYPHFHLISLTHLSMFERTWPRALMFERLVLPCEWWGTCLLAEIKVEIVPKGVPSLSKDVRHRGKLLTTIPVCGQDEFSAPLSWSWQSISEEEGAYTQLLMDSEGSFGKLTLLCVLYSPGGPVHEFSSCLMSRLIKSMSMLTRVKMTTPSMKLGEKDFWVPWKAAPRPVSLHYSKVFFTVWEGNFVRCAPRRSWPSGWTSDLWWYSFLSIDLLFRLLCIIPAFWCLESKESGVHKRKMRGIRFLTKRRTIFCWGSGLMRTLLYQSAIREAQQQSSGRCLIHERES